MDGRTFRIWARLVRRKSDPLIEDAMIHGHCSRPYGRYPKYPGFLGPWRPHAEPVFVKRLNAGQRLEPARAGATEQQRSGQGHQGDADRIGIGDRLVLDVAAGA